MPTKQPQASAGSRPQAVQLRARRSPRLIAVGLLAVVLGALGFAALHTATTHDTSIVTITQPVPRGTVLADEHLSVVQVPERLAADALPADAVATLVGRTALTDLPEGSFPRAHHVGDDPLPEGQAIVGLRLTHGQLPMTALPAGTAVQLVGLAEEGEPGLDVQAVIAVAPIELDGGAFALDVRVPADAAHAVARLAAKGELALVAVKGA